MNQEFLLDTVEAFSNQQILVLGDVMLDKYIHGMASRISPEAPVPVIETQRQSREPGGAANAAANIVSLRGGALLGGVIGRDTEAEDLRQTLSREGIDATGLTVDGERPTTTKSRIVAQNQQIVRVDTERRDTIAEDTEKELLSWIENVIKNVDSCLISDYDKGVISATLSEELIDIAQGNEKPVVVDPDGTSYKKYSGATIVTPNVEEVNRVFDDEPGVEDTIEEVGREFLETLGANALLVTQGNEGMTLFREENVVSIPSVARDVFDVTGAGDTVASVLALALAVQSDIEVAVKLSNVAASVVVGKFGTSTVDGNELKSEIREIREKL